MAAVMSRLMPAPSDARALTAYMSASQRDEWVRQKYNLQNENEYRKFLQDNAEAVANDMRFLQTETPPIVMPPPTSE